MDALHKAVSDGNTDKTSELLNAGADINLMLGMKGTPLCAAISSKQETSVKQLVDYGCDVNSRDFDREPPLCMAIRKGHNGIVKILLETPNIDVKKRDPVSERTPLCLGVLSRNNDILKMLVSAGCNLNESDVNGCTPLHLTIMVNNIDCLQTLLESGCLLSKFNTSGYFPLHTCIFEDNTNALEIIVKYCSATQTNDFDINVKTHIEGNTALHLTARKHQLSTAKFLIEHNADVNVTNHSIMTPLSIACSENETSMAKYFMKFGACPNGAFPDASYKLDLSHSDACVTPLYQSVVMGNIELVYCLITAGAIADHALFWALSKNKVAVAKYILHTEDIYSKINFEALPFISLAVVSCDNAVDIVERLIELRSDITLSLEESRRGPLHMAVIDQRNDVAELLLRHGAPMTKDITGRSPLHLSCYSETDDIDLVRLLILYGADINDDSHEGTIDCGLPILEAAVSGNSNIVSLLLHCGSILPTIEDEYFDVIEAAVRFDDDNDTGMVALMNRAKNGPPSLGVIVRNSIIKYCAISKIDIRVIKELNIPNQLKEFVLLRQLEM